MADVTVRCGNEFHMVSLCRPQSGGASRFEFGIIRMRSNDNDPEFFVIGVPVTTNDWSEEANRENTVKATKERISKGE
jgi:hypothetical protein